MGKGSLHSQPGESCDGHSVGFWAVTYTAWSSEAVPPTKVFFWGGGVWVFFLLKNKIPISTQGIFMKYQALG